MSVFTQAPKKIIVDLINDANPGLNLLESQVTFEAPVVEDGVRNTSLPINAVVGGPYLGAQTVYYDRLDLAAVVATKSGRIEKTDALTNNDQLIAAVNALYAINLTSDDYTIGAFPTWENIPHEEHTVSITAKPGSLIFIGSATVTLFLPQVDLADAISVNTLDGLNYEPPAE